MYAILQQIGFMNEWFHVLIVSAQVEWNWKCGPRGDEHNKICI